MAALPEEKIDIPRAALLISQFEYPHLNSSAYMARLDDMGERLRIRIAGQVHAVDLIDAINHLLFVEEGFKGNLENYYDPRNSFLNQVLDRKLGIPITLSLVFMEVGRRAGLNVQGINLPGHFIAALFHGNGALYVDPFNRGKILPEEECRHRMVTRSMGKDLLDGSLLEPVKPKALIVRLLRNLKSIYRRVNRDIKAFQMIEWILALNPNAGKELLERGNLYESMGAFDLAARDLKRFLALYPENQEKEAIQAKIQTLEMGTSRIH
jgi:regulator of sirC expression with transglutaminase-like and TPR domain